QFVRRALAQTRLVAEYVVSPLVFDDANGARDLMAKLLVDPNVAYVRLQDTTGAVFAEAAQSGTSLPTFAAGIRPSTAQAWRFAPDMLHVAAPVQHQGPLGTLSVGYRLTEIEEAVVAERRLLIAVTLCVIAVSWLMATLLQRAITNPLVRL